MARVTSLFDADGRLTVAVALSERNLLTLLSKLYTPGSTPAIYTGGGDSTLHVILAEDDETHYGHSARGGHPAGSMHPTTEAILRHLREVLVEMQRPQ